MVALAMALCLSACTVPGQRLDRRHREITGGAAKRVFERESEQGAAANYDLVQISPQVLQSLGRPAPVVPAANPQLEHALRSYRYRIGPQDVLTFTVWDHPEITIPAGEYRSAEVQGFLVGADGTIFFPYVGIVNVAGRTLAEVRTEVTGRLSRYIQNPQLDVRIAAFRSKKVQVSGEVKMPGVVPVTDVPLTLLQALELTGGGTADAALQSVEVVRNGTVRKFDVQALLERGNMREDLLLQDGDVVYVPDNSYFSVHVVGEVKTPGMVPMVHDRLNLAEALTRSGGFDLQNANPARVFVFRGTAEKPKVYWLDAQSPAAMLLATQFEMRPQDVVFVASTGLARWNRVVGLLLPTVQTLWQTQSLIDRLRNQ